MWYSKNIQVTIYRGMEEWEKLASDKFFHQATMNEPDEHYFVL